MSFINTFDIGDIIDFISLLLVLFGGIFGYHRWSNSSKIKRADYINELTEKIRTDVDIREIVYILDYNHSWYTERFHDTDDFERRMDKTLSYFSYICYLFKFRLIKKKEFYFFKYEIDRILMNKGVVEYLYNLYHFSEECNTVMTFKYLFDYGCKNKIFDNEFYNADSDQYPHFLTF